MGDRQSQQTQPKIEKWVGKHRGEQVARLLLWVILDRDNQGTISNCFRNAPKADAK